VTEFNGPLRELLTSARAAHARLCLDTVTIARITRGPLDTVTNRYPRTSVTVYTGQARFKRQPPTDQIVAEGQRQAARAVMVLPYSATGTDALLPGDVVTITTSVDESLTGKTVTVIGPELGTTTTAHRFAVEEVSL
jgi:Family of unknown function (DUF6093)